MLQFAAGLLVIQVVLYLLIQARAVRGRAEEAKVAEAPIPPGGGFGLVFANPYLRLIAVLIVILNLVNTNGNFVWNSAVVSAADAAVAANPSLDRTAYIGSVLGSFGFYQNILVVLLQALVVSRIVKYFGMTSLSIVRDLSTVICSREARPATPPTRTRTLPR